MPPDQAVDGDPTDRRSRRRRAAKRHEPDATDTDGPDREQTEEAEDGERQARAPWHFKVILVGSVVYLGWLLYQGISWLAHHL